MKNSLESKEKAMIQSFITGDAKEFCTPVVINAGWVLDPTGPLISAKQLAQSLSRNVLLQISLKQDNVDILYYIQVKNYQGVVVATEVRVAVATITG